MMKTINRCQSFRLIGSALWEQATSLRFRLSLSLCLVILGVFFNLSLPWCLKFIIDAFESGQISGQLVDLLVGYGILWMLTNVLVNIRQIMVYRIFERTIRRLSQRIFNQLLSLPLSYHFEHAIGEVTNVIERAQMALPNILAGFLFVIIPTIVEILLAVGLLGCYYGISYAMMLLGVLVSYISFVGFVTPWVISAQRESNRHHSRVSRYVTDILMNMEMIHYQWGHQFALRAGEKRFLDRENAVTRQLIRSEIVGLGQHFIAGLGLILMTAIVGRAVIHQQLVISDFILFNGYLLQFLIPLNMMGLIMRDIRDGLTKMEAVAALLQQPIEIADHPSANILQHRPSEIVFRQVGFTYPHQKKPVLYDINLTLPKGQTLAIVGPNGSGKSTLIKLLYRLFDVSNGQIMIQQQDIRDIRLASLRSLIAIVPQEVFLLDDTIEANICFGTKMSQNDGDKDKVMQVTQLKNWLATLPEGEQTLAGQRGIKLSGGEKRRIAIARALLRNPKILVLDEAMASLDASSECQILTHLREDYRNLTKIIVTHHEKELANVDEVMYLDKGTIQMFENAANPISATT